MVQTSLRISLMTLLMAGSLTFLASQSYAGPSCTCRYAGQSFQVNSCVCITTSAVGPQIACCGMVVNNTSWTFTKNACPSADLLNAPSKSVEIAQTPAPANAVDLITRSTLYSK